MLNWSKNSGDIYYRQEVNTPYIEITQQLWEKKKKDIYISTSLSIYSQVIFTYIHDPCTLRHSTSLRRNEN